MASDGIEIPIDGNPTGFKRSMQEVMQSSKDAAEINYVCAKLRPIYLKFSQPKNFSGDPNKVLLELDAWVRTQISGLLLTIAARDVELFRLKGGGDE